MPAAFQSASGADWCGCQVGSPPAASGGGVGTSPGAASQISSASESPTLAAKM
jgi:hypothetical protein